MAKKTTEIGDPSNQFSTTDPSEEAKEFLRSVLPHVINAVQATYSGTSKVAAAEKGKTYVEHNGPDRMKLAKSLASTLASNTPAGSLDADFIEAEIEKTLAEMKRNNTLVK